MEILLAEDNRTISSFLVKGLEESGHTVTLAETGEDARDRISNKEWDIILLDLMLTGIDGFELLQYTRYKKNLTPILVISALNEPEDKVRALGLGADDYIVKPFHFSEMMARINALTRRANYYHLPESECLECGDLKLFIHTNRAVRNGREIRLTHQEYKLLKLLLENEDKVVPRAKILDTVWEVNFESNTNVVDVYISYLRNKVHFTDMAPLIFTVKGRGYIISSKGGY